MTTMTASSWTWLSHFVLRSTGFPFEWIEKMRMKDTEQVLRDVFAWEEKRLYLLKRWEQDVLPLLTAKGVRWEKNQQRVLTKVYKKVKKSSSLNESEWTVIVKIGHPELSSWAHEWQETLKRLDQLDRQAEEVFAGEWKRVQEALHRHISNPRFREAVYLSNPSFYERGFAYFDQHCTDPPGDTRWRQLERQFFTYLQRFTAKNETTSFFGPINYGRIVEEEGTEPEAALTADWPECFDLEKRVAFYAFRVLQELAALVAKDPELGDVVPLLFQGSSKQLRLEGFTEGMSVREWAKARGEEVEQTRQKVRGLMANRTLKREFPIPSSVIHGMSDLIERIRRLQTVTEMEAKAQARWISVLMKFRRYQRQFEEGALTERVAILRQVEKLFSDLTHLRSRRGEGALFQDRTVLYEDAKGNLDIRLNSRLVEKWQADLSGPLSMAAVYTKLCKQRNMKIALQVYRQVFGNRKAVRFDQFIVACHKRLQQETVHIRGENTEPLDHFFRLFSDSCEAYLEGRSSTLISPELWSFLRENEDEDLYIISPDLLLMADSVESMETDRLKCVLGELHHGITMEGWMLSFHPDQAHVRKEIHQEIARHLEYVQQRSNRGILPANLIFTRKMKTAPQEYPGVMVEVSGYASRRRPEATFGLKDLVVKVEEEELILSLRGEDREIRFYPPAFGFTEQAYFPFALFSFPIVQMPVYRTEGHTPRIETEHLVLQRAQWRFAREELQEVIKEKESFRAYIAMQKFRRRHGLPRHVFLRVPSEQKPVYLDLENSYAVDLLQHLAGKNRTVTFGEMLPSPDQLWLRDQNGIYCSELRTLLMRSRIDERKMEAGRGLYPTKHRIRLF